MIKELIYFLVNDSFGQTRELDIGWTFQNLIKIKDQLFSENFDEFLSFFDLWQRHYSKINEKEISFFPEEVIALSFDNSLREYRSVEFISETCQKNLKKQTADEWLGTFEDEDIRYFAFKGYIENNLLDQRISKGREFMNAYGDYLSLIAKRERKQYLMICQFGKS